MIWQIEPFQLHKSLLCIVVFFSFFFLKKIIIAFCKGKSYMRIINENPLNCFATSHKDTTFSCCLCAFVFLPKSSSWVGLFSFEKCHRLDQTSWLPVKKSGVKFASLPDKFLLRRVQWGASWTVLKFVL